MTQRKEVSVAPWQRDPLIILERGPQHPNIIKHNVQPQDFEDRSSRVSGIGRLLSYALRHCKTMFKQDGTNIVGRDGFCSIEDLVFHHKVHLKSPDPSLLAATILLNNKARFEWRVIGGIEDSFHARAHP